MDISNLICEIQNTDINIKDKPLLISVLSELNSMIGMSKLKRSVIDQLLFILSNIRTKGIENATDGHVLHTIIYGPPGVGKTIVGSILAKIWSSLGILGKGITNSNSEKEQTSLKLIKDNLLLYDKNRILEEKITRSITSSIAADNYIKELRSRLFAIRTKTKRYTESHPINTISEEFKNIYKSIQSACRVSSEVLNYSTMTLNSLQNQNSSNEQKSQPDQTNIPRFKVVSRIDFVAEYVGQTAVKTKKLLDEYRGGVLFVDEAYSLHHASNDSYGSEALTVINQYMTEHADSTVLIFAGYKETMQSSIFKAQQGLVRRFGFTFEIDGYDVKDLTEIFKLQLSKDGWSLDFDPFDFFKENYSYFPSYGGDTQRLIFQAKIVYSTYNWNKNLVERVINLDVLNSAFERYKNNMSLDLEKIKMLENHRQYEDEIMRKKIKEHEEQKEHEELYEKYRQFQRKEMETKIKEQEEKSKTDKKFEDPPYGMYS